MQKKIAFFPKITFIDKQIVKKIRKNFTLCRHLEWNAGIIFYIPQNNIPNYLHSLSIFRPYSTSTWYRKPARLERNCGESKPGVHACADVEHAEWSAMAWCILGTALCRCFHRGKERRCELRGRDELLKEGISQKGEWGHGSLNEYFLNIYCVNHRELQGAYCLLGGYR